MFEIVTIFFLFYFSPKISIKWNSYMSSFLSLVFGIKCSFFSFFLLFWYLHQYERVWQVVSFSHFDKNISKHQTCYVYIYNIHRKQKERYSVDVAMVSCVIYRPYIRGLCTHVYLGCAGSAYTSISSIYLVERLNVECSEEIKFYRKTLTIY